MPAQPRLIPPNLRKALLREIDAWEAEGLLTPEQSAALRARYAASPPPSPSPEQPPAAVPSPTLSERIFSETSIKVALYLGAFFVIGAALILAALVEVARLPILLSLTAAFGALALLLRYRLPQPAFAFYTVASFLLLISAGVVAQQQDLPDQLAQPYWTAVFWGITAVWAGGVLLYRSRLFSLFAFLGGILGTIALFGWLNLDAPWLMPLMVLWCLAGQFGSRWMNRRWPPRFGRPLFWLTQLTLGVTLLFAIGHAFSYWDDYFFSQEHWLAPVNALAWLLSAAYFEAARRAGRRGYRWPAAAALLPLPWLLLVGLGVRPDADLHLLVQWLWGTLLAGGGLWLERRQAGFSSALLPLSMLPLIGALIVALAQGQPPELFWTLCGLTLTWVAVQVVRPRWWIWQAALLAATGAFFTFFEMPWMEGISIFTGYKATFAALALLLPDVLLRRQAVHTAWRWPPRLLGLLLAAGNVYFLTQAGPQHYGRVALVFGVYTLFGFIYAAAARRPAYGWAATIASMFSLVFGLQAAQYDLWVWPLTALGAAWYLAGWWLQARRLFAPEWSNLLRYSGLAFAAQAGLSAVFEDSTALVSVWVAAGATLFAVEAWRQRNVWLGFPATLLYLVAYFLLLGHLEVSQPQFYSVGAAALGLVMHYLLTRSGNRLATFLTGTLSQLTLLSTTYVQMIREEKFVFFAMLFFQALVVLLYGVFIRSRSLVLVPVGFAVLAVLTVAFNILQGLSTALLVGCTGVTLLLFATLALLLRERLGELRTRWERWQP